MQSPQKIKRWAQKQGTREERDKRRKVGRKRRIEKGRMLSSEDQKLDPNLPEGLELVLNEP